MPAPTLIAELGIHVASDFVDPSRGPEPRGDFEVSPALFLVLLGVGFALGALGHLIGSRPLIALGVALVMLATVLIPIALHATR